MKVKVKARGTQSKGEVRGEKHRKKEINQLPQIFTSFTASLAYLFVVFCNFHILPTVYSALLSAQRNLNNLEKISKNNSTKQRTEVYASLVF